MSRLVVGQRVPERVVVDLGLTTWRIPHSRLLHLQFRRFAGCPICTVHLARFAQRIDELDAAGIQELVVFAASREAMLPFHGDLPFPSAPDLERSLYAAYGIESSVTASIAPTAWVKAAAGLLRGEGLPNPEKKSAAMIHPADFLIAPDGTLLDVHYGADPHDSWSVDDVLSRAPTRARTG